MMFSIGMFALHIQNGGSRSNLIKLSIISSINTHQFNPQRTAPNAKPYAQNPKLQINSSTHYSSQNLLALEFLPNRPHHLRLLLPLALEILHDLTQIIPALPDLHRQILTPTLTLPLVHYPIRNLLRPHRQKPIPTHVPQQLLFDKSVGPLLSLLANPVDLGKRVVLEQRTQGLDVEPVERLLVLGFGLESSCLVGVEGRAVNKGEAGRVLLVEGERNETEFYTTGFCHCQFIHVLFQYSIIKGLQKRRTTYHPSNRAAKQQKSNCQTKTVQIDPLCLYVRA